MSLTKLSLDGNTVLKFFPAWESLVSDIPAKDGKIANLFFTVYSLGIKRKLPLLYSTTTEIKLGSLGGLHKRVNPNAGGGEGSCGISANEYSCTQKPK
jgi:hypothetical protein